MNAQQLFASLSMWTIRSWFLTACLLLIGSGCDGFIVPLCVFNRDSEECADMSSVDGPRTDSSSTSPSSPIGPPRKFEWRAKIGDLLSHNFVGIDKRQYAIVLVGGPPVHFEAVKFRFDLPANMNQLEQIACMGCPNLVDINFFSDYIFLTGEAEPQFWLLRYGAVNKSYVLKADGSLVLMDADMDPSWWIKPFFHPVLNASSIAVKPTMGGMSSLVARLPKNGDLIKYGIERPKKISAQAIGDLDSVEPRKNGLDIINIGNNSIDSVFHYDTDTNANASDDALRGRIAETVAKTKRSNSAQLETAYIENLNKDEYIEFIYSWSGRIYVASYTGNWVSTGSSLLEDWGKEVVTVPAGETIRKIMALDLTKDGFPELIVETDKAVHFYLNTP